MATYKSIGKRFNPPVSAKIGVRFDARETREVIGSLTAVNIEVLIVDLDSVDEAELLDAMNAYRVQRSQTRIIVYALGRVPGDRTLAMLRALQINDLLAPDKAPGDTAEYIIEALQAPAGRSLFRG